MPVQQEGEREAAATEEHLRLVRWSCSMGSNVQSRASVVIESGDHRWQAAGRGTGPVEALFRAVDTALQDVLAGHPRLLGYDVHAMAEGPDSVGRVTVKIAPPSDAPGARSSGTYEAVSQSPNIIAASVEAYIEAIEQMLAEEHWEGATEDAGNFLAALRPTDNPPEYDPHARPDHSRWWNP